MYLPISFYYDSRYFLRLFLNDLKWSKQFKVPCKSRPLHNEGQLGKHVFQDYALRAVHTYTGAYPKDTYRKESIDSRYRKFSIDKVVSQYSWRESTSLGNDTVLVSVLQNRYHKVSILRYYLILTKLSDFTILLGSLKGFNPVICKMEATRWRL